ncbi:MAG: DNA methyltransferase [Bacteroidota bacterium]|nr:DNA methyltransferase [Bacteroidota bacterium]
MSLTKNEILMIERGFFKPDILNKLAFIKRNILKSNFSGDIKNMLLLLLSSIIVKESNMIRRADLRYKRDAEFQEIDENVFELFRIKTRAALKDLENLDVNKIGKTNLVSNDAKRLENKYNNTFDTIITSPPYVNGTNYFRNTKLELLFLDLVNQEKEMKRLREEAITSGINNVSQKKKLNKTEFEQLNAIIEQHEKNNYDKRIPRLIEHYFYDMRIVLKNLYFMLEEGGNFYFDIGDSIFNNIHVPTDILFEEIAKKEGFNLVNKTKIRNRFSKNGAQLGQWLIQFTKKNGTKYHSQNYNNNIIGNIKEGDLVIKNWQKFRDEIPYRKHPFAKRNWGNNLHSLCSYQGKLKPAIAHFLVKYFSNENSIILDPLSGVGTIPLEASLQNRKVYANDLSLIAYANTLAKVGIVNNKECSKIIDSLREFIGNDVISNLEFEKSNFGFNKKLQEYYHEDTFKEILSARKYFIQRGIKNENYAFVFSSLLHILHGNRPYALSRTSHPITPFAPKGEFLYKNLIEKLKGKINRAIIDKHNCSNNNYEIFQGDFTDLIKKIKKESIDLVITSPPFYDSTRFYMANWIRMWFSGWDKDDFQIKKESYLETKQLQNIQVYNSFFQTMTELLKENSDMILHLGFSKKANMAELLIPMAEKYFNVIGYFNENVTDNEKFGIKDQGAVKVHQYLFLKKQ